VSYRLVSDRPVEARMPSDGASLPLEQAMSVFAASRRRLFRIAYRRLGSLAEAEDIVQEAWIRWQATDRDEIRDPAAFLATVTARLALTAAQSARARLETCVGRRLPEPVDTSADPTLGAERSEALELAVLQLLERLQPMERAAYVLREAFEYSYAQIADVLDVSEANARQLGSRGRKHLCAERRAKVGVGEQHRLMEGFLAAAQNGDVGALERLFVEDIVGVPDGRGGGARCWLTIDAAPSGIEITWLMNPRSRAVSRRQGGSCESIEGQGRGDHGRRFGNRASDESTVRSRGCAGRDRRRRSRGRERDGAADHGRGRLRDVRQGGRVDLERSAAVHRCHREDARPPRHPLQQRGDRRPVREDRGLR
jgi:RNA polymerase sigma-70 factor (ECF subfamily)